MRNINKLNSYGANLNKNLEVIISSMCWICFDML